MIACAFVQIQTWWHACKMCEDLTLSAPSFLSPSALGPASSPSAEKKPSNTASNSWTALAAVAFVYLFWFPLAVLVILSFSATNQSHSPAAERAVELLTSLCSPSCKKKHRYTVKLRLAVYTAHWNNAEMWASAQQRHIRSLMDGKQIWAYGPICCPCSGRRFEYGW